MHRCFSVCNDFLLLAKCLWCRTLGISSSFWRWPKTNRLKIVLQQRWIYSQDSRELWFGICNCREPHQVPKQQEKEKAFIERKMKLGGPQKHKVFHGFSLAESLPGKESLSSFSWAVLLSHVRAPPPGSQLYLIEVSGLLFFYFSPLLIKIFLWKHHWSRVGFSDFHGFLSFSVRKDLSWV